MSLERVDSAVKVSTICSVQVKKMSMYYFDWCYTISGVVSSGIIKMKISVK